MRVAIVHDQITSASEPDARDVLVQAQAVQQGLDCLGHETKVFDCDLDLGRTIRALKDFQAAVVFNLVESIQGHGRLIHLFPFCLDAAGLPYTGASAEAMSTTSNKTAAKIGLRTGGLSTPDWVGPFPAGPGSGLHADEQPSDWIIKSVWEHASIGLDDGAVVRNRTAREIMALLPARSGVLGKACFGERFIHGREFNLSLLGGKTGPLVLPPAEIQFMDYGPDRPKIVDYRAKWDEQSFEYQHTSRSFEFSAADEPLLLELRRLARQCWDLFRLQGYARVDFRVDAQGRPWILEINANPCLAPDAGFAAALARAGLTFPQALVRIMEDITTSLAQSRKAPLSSLALREQPKAGDPGRIRRLVARTGFFSREEEAVAEELVQERLDKGEASGYYFVFAEDAGRLIGYTCFGPIPCTESSFDLYWIAVEPDLQAQGLGRHLLLESAKRIRAAGGKRIYADTSQRAQYQSTRAFYERNGFCQETILADFYAPGDGKVIYCKNLE